MGGLKRLAYALSALGLGGCVHTPPPAQGPRGLMGASSLDAESCYGTPARKEPSAAGQVWTYYRSHGPASGNGSVTTTADVSSCVITLELTSGHVTSISTRPVGPNADPLVCADLASACAH